MTHLIIKLINKVSMKTNTLDWDSLTQGEARTALRNMLELGQLKTFYHLSDMRKLINGEKINGFKRLTAEDLRTIGKLGEFQADKFKESQVVTEELAAMRAIPNTVNNLGMADGQAAAPAPAPAPAGVNQQQAFEAFKQIFQPQTPQLDVGRVRQEAFEVQKDSFGKLFEDQLTKSPDAIEKAISNTVGKFANDELKATVSALMQTELGESIRGAVASGDKSVLPPILGVAPYFRENRTTKQIETGVLSKNHMIVSGPSGSGKTFPVEQVLNKLGRRWVKISCSDGISMSELVAEKTIEIESGAPVMKTILKFLPIAAREGLAVILDEADQLQSELLSAVNSYTDAHPAQVTIPQTGERITAHSDFLVIFTMNGLTDETGLYSGHQISGALKTRCRFVYADYLNKREESNILKADGLTDQQASDLVDKFSILRKAHTAGTLTMPPSTRTMLNISKALQAKDSYGQEIEALDPMSLDEALHVTVINALTPTEAKEVKKLLSI